MDPPHVSHSENQLVVHGPYYLPLHSSLPGEDANRSILIEWNDWSASSSVWRMHSSRRNRPSPLSSIRALVWIIAWNRFSSLSQCSSVTFRFDKSWISFVALKSCDCRFCSLCYFLVVRRNDPTAICFWFQDALKTFLFNINLKVWLSVGFVAVRYDPILVWFWINGVPA